MQERAENNVVKSVKEISETLLNSCNMELVDIEYRGEGRGKVLRIYIEKENGVTVDDCADISRELSLVLDVNNVIQSRYTLEVSSPGLRRPLKKIEDFRRFKGKFVLIKTKEPINNRRVFKGTLDNCLSDHIVIEIDSVLYEVPFRLIRKANLEINF